MNPIFRRICNVILIVLLLGGVAYIGYQHDWEWAREKESMEMHQESVAEPEPEETLVEEIPVEEPVPESMEAVEESVIYCETVIDFTEQQEENKDIYAWLNVPGTEIEYPVLQSEEDNYYLNRNVDGSQGYPGSIYTNKCNTKDFTDAITVLYGHNMKNGSMFAGLHKFRDPDFFAENDQILIYTEEARYTYQIYMAAAYGDPYIPAMFDVSAGEDAVAFCEDVEAYEDDRKLIREDMEVGEEDCLLILSTCIANEGTKRYLVIGKLVETALYYE